LSPSGNHKLLLDEKTETFSVLARRAGAWTETAKGRLQPQVGCTHLDGTIADGGTHFAAWRIPYNHTEEKNTPLAVYFGDGTHFRTYGLFELFDRDFLAPEIRFARGLA
jgi:hypothetical protein